MHAVCKVLSFTLQLRHPRYPIFLLDESSLQVGLNLLIDTIVKDLLIASIYSSFTTMVESKRPGQVYHAFVFYSDLYCY